MITREDLEQAICECQAEREPNANTCIKLAAFLTIRELLYNTPEPNPAPDVSHETLNYSYAAPPDVSHETIPDTVYIDSGSEFAKAINGMDETSAWLLMEELMSTIKIVFPRLYDGVMRKIKKS